MTRRDEYESNDEELRVPKSISHSDYFFYKGTIEIYDPPSENQKLLILVHEKTNITYLPSYYYPLYR